MTEEEAKKAAISEVMKVSEKIDERAKKIIDLLASLTEGTKRQAALAPGMYSPLQPLLEASPEDLGKMVNNLLENHPDVAEALTHALTQVAAAQNKELQRIDKRVQDPDKPRERPEFKSFCRRKGEW